MRGWFALGLLVSMLPACAGKAAGPGSDGATTTRAPATTDATTTTSIAGTSTSTVAWVSDTGYVPFGVEVGNPCLARAVFDDPAESPYLLPFAVGERYQVSQSYCIQAGGHRDQIAYDFIMSVGEDVLAMRAGEVIFVEEGWPDDGEGPGEHNMVLILHGDGTVGFYAHLRQDGVDVEVGDMVEAGDRIAASGRSGQVARAHLHVQVFRNRSTQNGDDIPFNFSNAAGALDPRGGLITGWAYQALPPG